MRNDRGMGLIVAVILTAVVAIGLGLVAPAVYQVTAADNSAKTAEDLDALKVALAGNPRLVNSGGRADFGFIGSMGNVPSSLSQLWQIPDPQKFYKFDINRKVGAGWVGPYIPSSFVNDLIAMDKDRYGNPFVYTSTPFARTESDSQMVAARIRSAGPDGTPNTGDDQLVDILEAEVYSTVTGTLRKGANPVKYATVSLNIPTNGGLTQAFAVTDENGLFEFEDVTFGLRSLGIDPKLTFEDGSVTDPGNDRVKFTVTNFATNDIPITSITISATQACTPEPCTGPPLVAYYQELRIGGTTVFDWNNGTRNALGATVGPFAPITVKGSGKPIQVVPIRVEKETTVTPDLLIKGIGKSAVVLVMELRNVATGTGSGVNPVDPSGAEFTVTFDPDGSQAVFTVP